MRGWLLLGIAAALLVYIVLLAPLPVDPPPTPPGYHAPPTYPYSFRGPATPAVGGHR